MPNCFVGENFNQLCGVGASHAFALFLGGGIGVSSSAVGCFGFHVVESMQNALVLILGAAGDGAVGLLVDRIHQTFIIGQHQGGFALAGVHDRLLGVQIGGLVHHHIVQQIDGEAQLQIDVDQGCFGRDGVAAVAVDEGDLPENGLQGAGSEACSYVVSVESETVDATVEASEVDTTVAGVKTMTLSAKVDGEVVATKDVKVVVAPRYERTYVNGKVAVLKSFYLDGTLYSEYHYDWAAKTYTATFYANDGVTVASTANGTL